MSAPARNGSRFDARLPSEGRLRAVIEHVTPQVDGGRFAIKRTLGESVTVEADAFADGHERIACVLRYRHESSSTWQEQRMQPLGNDRWRGSFRVQQLGVYRYLVQAWIDVFGSWRNELARRSEEDPDLPAALAVGARLVEEVAAHAGGADAQELHSALARLRGAETPAARRSAALSERLAELMASHAARTFATDSAAQLPVVVDRERARFGAWYEFFPRSCNAGVHAHLSDCEACLDHIAGMGFDVVYLPPVHPIGRSFRKGPDNSLAATAEDVGSPWGIGAREGGHKALHPQLGTIEDFARFVAAARARNLEIALDLALQCSPDHPYVREHPEWFRHRPDGSIQYAENPPKKYQDIYPFDFECAQWRELWSELKSIVDFWIGQGVHIFRVDNPHTKPFAFWEWLIEAVKREHPEVLFLAEAFTRPKVMQRLAKLGFTQSYTYFTWRNTKRELTDYLTELMSPPVSDYLRPNFWPNTPDILSEYLQFGGRAAFMIRLVLAATLAANYGIYGPAFELTEATARQPGSEEYDRSEKYELRSWDLGRADSLRDFIARVNRIRRENPALQSDGSLRFHSVDNEQLLCYSKVAEDADNIVLVVVNLDPHYRQSGWLELPLDRFGLAPGIPYQMHDLLSGAHYLWNGTRNYVELNPHGDPAHIFRMRRRVRREQDFDYFM
jgi:starch synthase (maltosyl-transferring)